MIPAGLGKGVEANMNLAVNPVQRMVADIMPNSLLNGMASLPVSSPVLANTNGEPRVSAPITVNTSNPTMAARETVRMINFAYV